MNNLGLVIDSTKRARGSTLTGSPKASHSNARISTADAKPHDGAEGEPSGHDGAAGKLVCEPVESRADVVLLTSSFIMRAFTESDAAKVEPQHPEAERLKHFGHPEQQLVAHDAPVKRVRMAEKDGR